MASYNKKAHLRANIEAIKVAFTLERERRVATPEEISIIKEYSGFGGLKSAFSAPPCRPTHLLSRLSWLTVSLPAAETLGGDGAL